LSAPIVKSGGDRRKVPAEKSIISCDLLCIVRMVE
jgi:hypothetical protein